MVDIKKSIKIEDGTDINFDPEEMSEISDIIETMSEQAYNNDQNIFVEIKGQGFDMTIDVSNRTENETPTNPYEFWTKILGWVIVATVLIVVFGN